MKDESIKNNLTTLSNDIVKAKYKLDLPTHKLVLVGISKIDNRQVGEDIDGMDGKVVVPSSVEISVEEYASACEISVEHAKDVFQEVVNKLFEAEVAYWNVERSRYTRIRWVSSVEYDRTVHRVKLVWTEEVKPFICEQISKRLHNQLKD